ncbi:MAG: hypothetical protein IJ408_01160 [Clostridia bacterium]|nr:hypothetical protein [Clostridia bacterium]
MLIDITGTVLTPGNQGEYCLGNGRHTDENRKEIACCCDECDYGLCCIPTHNMNECIGCSEKACPNCK